MTAAPEITVRRADPGDPDELAAVVALAGRALGWDDGGPHVDLFRWKHLDNPFGTSPMWVAHADDRLVGVRVFLRWRWRAPDTTTVAGVRAVDTATAPEAQGRGVFTRLTTDAVDELRAAGVGFVCNTPNDQSRPGYLKMGWQVVGRVPIVSRPSGVRGLRRMAGARRPAEKWSEPSSAGVAAADFFADAARTAGLLARRRPGPGWSTDHDPASLSWRYRFPDLHYRCLPAGDDIADGAVVFRVRRRGTAREATVCEVLVPPRAPVGRLLRAVLHQSGADYLVATRATAGRHGLPMPGQGPVLTWRPLARPGVPDLRSLDLALGDIELF